MINFVISRLLYVLFERDAAGITKQAAEDVDVQGRRRESKAEGN